MRRIKTIGLALSLAMALAAIGGVTSASASGGFLAETYPAVFKGEPTGDFQLGVGSSGLTLTCSGQSFEGEQMPPIQTLTPSQVEDATCNNSGTISMNGCRFEFNADGAGIGPAGCGEVVVKWKYWQAECEKRLAPQSGATTGYENVGSGSSASVVITNIGSLQYSSNDSSVCGENSGYLSLAGSWQLSATDVGGDPNGLAVVSDLPVGTYMEGESFASEAYPTVLSGSQTAGEEHVITLNTSPLVQTITCSDVEFNSQLDAAADEVTVAAQYSGCVNHVISIYQLPVTVVMNGCGYVLKAATDSIRIECVGEEEAIEIRTYDNPSKQEADEPLCVDRIGEQSGDATYGTYLKTGEWRSILVDIDMDGLAYDVSGSEKLCGTSGEHTDGEYIGGTTLDGYFE